MLGYHGKKPIHKLLVFRIGQLGDSIVGLPAIWALRRHFENAEFTLLSDSDVTRKELVPALEVYLGTGMFSELLEYNAAKKRSPFNKIFSQLALLLKLRSRRFDCVAYLVPSQRNPIQQKRDRQFFRLAGISQSIGFEGFEELDKTRPLAVQPREADLLLKRLAASSIPVPPAGEGRMDLNLGPAEEEAFRRWCSQVKPPVDRQWVAVAPGSKMKAKQWPVANFGEVISDLIGSLNVYPIIFGGPEDRTIGDQLIAKWGDGHNAAGTLSIRESARALKHCCLYLGNDTGTMHLAASVSLRCLAIFSSRDSPGRWFPYGNGHCAMRSQIECEGCMLEECLERKNECVKRISVAQVRHKAVEMLADLKPATAGSQSY